jgi:hypothetical protein
MTDKLLSLAREVGAETCGRRLTCRQCRQRIRFSRQPSFTAFVERIRQEERERCAAICDEIERQQENDNGAANTGGAAACAAAIRGSKSDE